MENGEGRIIDWWSDQHIVDADPPRGVNDVEWATININGVLENQCNIFFSQYASRESRPGGMSVLSDLTKL